MSATTAPTQATPRRGGRAGFIALAVIMMVLGVIAALGGGALLIAFGSDGQITSDTHPVTTPTAAVITDVATISNTSQVADAVGTPTVHVTASGVFVGIGSAADVDRYLAGVAVDQVRDLDLDPYVLNLSRLDGTAKATPPAEQTFWVASGSAAGVTDLTWNVRDGAYRMVLMNSDGTPGVSTRLSIGVGLPGAFGLAVGFLVGGLVLLAGGVAILMFASRRPARPHQAPAPATS